MYEDKFNHLNLTGSDLQQHSNNTLVISKTFYHWFSFTP